MTDWSRAHKANSWRSLALVLLVLICLVYSPLAIASFNSDDFTFLKFLHFDLQPLLHGQDWAKWFIGGVVNYAVFRPAGNLFWFLNYVTFGLAPFGYHITSLLFHFAASFAASILTYQLTRNKSTAGIAAVLFAVMPVHAEAVSWVAANYDVMSGMYFFLGFIFYILFRKRAAFWFYLVTLGAYIWAISSKETALTLPGMLFLYDVMDRPHDWRSALRLAAGYVPFGIIVALRFIYFGHGYRGMELAPEGWAYYAKFNLLRAFDPLFRSWDVNLDLVLGLTLLLALALLLAFRFRPIVLFALVWIPVTLIPTLVGGVSDRSFYIPSFGIALLLAVVFQSLLTQRVALVRRVAQLGLIGVIVVYGWSLYTRNQAYTRASQVAEAILQGTKELHPTFPSDARLVFVGVPDAVPEGPPVFGAGFREANMILYGNPNLQASKFKGFPLWLDNLDHTYFFSVDHRRVAERQDLMAALQARKSCSNVSQPMVTWNMASDAQGWEPWNQLEGAKNVESSLVMRSTGNDPFMGSPEIDIPSLTIGDIEITMRVSAKQPTFYGEVYWMTKDQGDFSPALKQSFSGPADGQFHTYRVDLAKTGMLLMDDHITRLRLDPVATTADIAIKSIQVDTHCDASSSLPCACAH